MILEAEIPTEWKSLGSGMSRMGKGKKDVVS